jgi:nitric oxide synthase-interacting protein
VACASNGDIFCRECAVSNLLAQRKEIKRLEKEDAKRKLEEEEDRVRDDEEARQKAVEDFEKIQMGLEAKIGKDYKVVGQENIGLAVDEDAKGDAKRGEKRKFELDEEELMRIAREDRGKARKAIEDEKVGCLIRHCCTRFEREC